MLHNNGELWLSYSGYDKTDHSPHYRF